MYRKLSLVLLVFIFITSCKEKCEQEVVFFLPNYVSSNCELVSDEEQKDCVLREMLAHIYDNLNYPQLAIDSEIEGTVVVRFMIGLDGNPLALEVTEGIGYGCDEEALRVVSTLRFNPAKNECGEDIVSTMSLFIKFRL